MLLLIERRLVRIIDVSGGPVYFRYRQPQIPPSYLVSSHRILADRVGKHRRSESLNIVSQLKKKKKKGGPALITCKM